jgi:hypothetical protein
VGLNPTRQAIEFSILNFNGELQTLSWDKPEERHTQKEILTPGNCFKECLYCIYSVITKIYIMK